MCYNIISFQTPILHIFRFNIIISVLIGKRYISLRYNTRLKNKIIESVGTFQNIFHILRIINKTRTLEIPERRQTIKDIIRPIPIYQLILTNKSRFKIPATIGVLILCNINTHIFHRIINRQITISY